MKRPAKQFTKPHDYQLVDRRMVCADCGSPMSAGVPSCPGQGAEKREQLRRDLGRILADALKGASE